MKENFEFLRPTHSLSYFEST